MDLMDNLYEQNNALDTLSIGTINIYISHLHIFKFSRCFYPKRIQYVPIKCSGNQCCSILRWSPYLCLKIFATFLLFSNQYFQLFPFISSDIHPYFILTTTPLLSDYVSRPLCRSVSHFLSLSSPLWPLALSLSLSVPAIHSKWLVIGSVASVLPVESEGFEGTYIAFLQG